MTAFLTTEPHLRSFPVSQLSPFINVSEGPCFQALGISQVFLAEWPEDPSENFQDYRLGQLQTSTILLPQNQY